MHVSTWRSELDYQVSPFILLYFLFFRQDFSLNMKLTDYARVANQLAPEVLLFTPYLPYQQWGYSVQFSTWVLETQPQVFTFVQQAL